MCLGLLRQLGRALSAFADGGVSAALGVLGQLAGLLLGAGNDHFRLGLCLGQGGGGLHLRLNQRGIGFVLLLALIELDLVADRLRLALRLADRLRSAGLGVLKHGVGARGGLLLQLLAGDALFVKDALGVFQILIGSGLRMLKQMVELEGGLGDGAGLLELDGALGELGFPLRQYLLTVRERRAELFELRFLRQDRLLGLGQSAGLIGKLLHTVGELLILLLQKLRMAAGEFFPLLGGPDSLGRPLVDQLFTLCKSGVFGCKALVFPRDLKVFLHDGSVFFCIALRLLREERVFFSKQRLFLAELLVLLDHLLIPGGQHAILFQKLCEHVLVSLVRRSQIAVLPLQNGLALFQLLLKLFVGLHLLKKQLHQLGPSDLSKFLFCHARISLPTGSAFGPANTSIVSCILPYFNSSVNKISN